MKETTLREKLDFEPRSEIFDKVYWAIMTNSFPMQDIHDPTILDKTDTLKMIDLFAKLIEVKYFEE